MAEVVASPDAAGAERLEALRGAVERFPFQGALKAALRARGGGDIIATASMAGLVATPFDPIYGANKAAVIGLVRGLGPNHLSENIRINALCPGFTRTPMAMGSIAAMGLEEAAAAASAPINRIADPQEQSDAALYLCSDRASFVIGHAFVCDGGHSIQ